MNLKLALHIPFFLKSSDEDYNKKRLNFINNTINNINQYQIKTDLFLHCNTLIDLNYFNSYINGKLHILYHNITNERTPMILTRKPRSLMLQQINEYDYFAYMEDDINFTKDNLNYWLQYKDECIKENYNLGFCRYEIKNNQMFITDITQNFKKTIIINNNNLYAINDNNTYCAFWIYDKQEFNKFIKHKTFNNLELMSEYNYAEKSAIGFTKLGYKNTLIPLIDNKLHPNCKIQHLSNNYINHPMFCKIKFDDAIQLT
jgi:hypothetical protein